MGDAVQTKSKTIQHRRIQDNQPLLASLRDNMIFFDQRRCKVSNLAQVIRSSPVNGPDLSSVKGQRSARTI